MPEPKKHTGDLGGGVSSEVVGAILNHPETQKAIAGLLAGIAGALVNGIVGLINKPKPVAPIQPVTAPTPNPGSGDDDFPDDVIPAPQGEVKIKTVRLKVARVQLNRQRFPGAPNSGLLSDADIKEINSEKQAINYASKVWYDLTAFDENGREIMRDRVLSAGLAYETYFNIGGATYKGNGAAEDGQPEEPTHSATAEVGFGWEAWRSSLGFLLQTKHHAEGKFLVWGEVGGVKSNQFTVTVS